MCDSFAILGKVEQWIKKNKDMLKRNKLPDNTHARIAAMIPGML